MDIIISLACWNRPVYLMKVLDGLSKCYNLDNFKLLISCDYFDKNTCEQILEAIKSTNILHVVDTNIIFHDRILGCAGNTRFCLEYGFKDGQDYTIHLEDDTYPSPDLLLYFEQVAPILDEEQLFAACTFHRPCHELVAPSPETIDRLTFKYMFEGAGGFAITKARWNRIQEMGGMFGVEYIPQEAKNFDCRGEEWRTLIKESDRLGFDWPFDRYFSERRPSIYPRVSRVLNIGRSGLHLNVNQWAETHYNPNWALNPIYLSLITPDIKFDTENFIPDFNKYTENDIQGSFIDES